jgi:hypothetical protein
MLFLLMQMTIAVQGEKDKSVGLSNPWTEYVRSVHLWLACISEWRMAADEVYIDYSQNMCPFPQCGVKRRDCCWRARAWR